MMKNLDQIERERREREASATAAQAADQEGEQKQEPETQPEDNGGDGKLFTQAEVNRIVSERLARERAKGEPTAEEQKAAELEARENRMKCRDYLEQHLIAPRIIPDILELFSTDNYDDFVESVEKLRFVYDRISELQKKGEMSPTEWATPDDLLRTSFGLD